MNSSLHSAPVNWDEFWEGIQNEPHGHDVFRLLRQVDAIQALQGKPRLGTCASPTQESVRVGQTPSMVFAPAAIHSVQAQGEHTPAQLKIYGFGLLGPNGPMPLHYTEHLYQRSHNYDDHAGVAFLDIFHHRLALLFYRAWAQAQAVCDLEHDESEFTRWLAAIAGVAPNASCPVLPTHAVYYQAPALSSQVRSASGLAALLRSYFQLPVHVQENVPTWLKLKPAQQARLGAPGQALGGALLIGQAVLDVQHTVRVCIGPLSLTQYRDFLPAGRSWKQLEHWLALYLGLEWRGQLQPILHEDQVPSLTLQSSQGLGLSSWLGGRPAGHARDLVLDLELRQQTRSERTVQPF